MPGPKSGFAQIPQTQAELDKLERMRAWMRGMTIPTLQDVPMPPYGERTAPTIMLFPRHEGSRMPLMDNNYWRRKATQRGGPA